MRRVSVASLLAWLLVPALAQAAAAPRFLPARDAMITYRSIGADAAMPPSFSVRWRADLGRLRIDGLPLGWVLVDLSMERVELVMPQPRLIIEMPPGGGLTEGFILGPGLGFTRIGADTVLGHPCTLYDVSADHGRANGRACLTSDGLLLRGEARGADGRHAGIEAVMINQVPQPLGLFAPPDNFRIVEVPK